MRELSAVRERWGGGNSRAESAKGWAWPRIRNCRSAKTNRALRHSARRSTAGPASAAAAVGDCAGRRRVCSGGARRRGAVPRERKICAVGRWREGSKVVAKVICFAMADAFISTTQSSNFHFDGCRKRAKVGRAFVFLEPRAPSADGSPKIRKRLRRLNGPIILVGLFPAAGRRRYTRRAPMHHSLK